jgi:hypothetical protein
VTERVLVAAAVAGVFGWMVFTKMRQRARASSEARLGIITRMAIGSFLGAVLAFWVSTHIPETPGSPASMVGVILAWLVGGGLLFLSLCGLAGAVVSQPHVTDTHEAHGTRE